MDYAAGHCWRDEDRRWGHLGHDGRFHWPGHEFCELTFSPKQRGLARRLLERFNRGRLSA